MQLGAIGGLRAALAKLRPRSAAAATGAVLPGAPAAAAFWERLADLPERFAAAVPVPAPHLVAPVLPLSLTELEGTLLQFAALQGALLELEDDRAAGAEAVHGAHLVLKAAGALGPEKLRSAIEDYLKGGCGRDGGEVGAAAVSAALATLDARLLAGHGVLLEDLPSEVLARWSQAPEVLTSAEHMGVVRHQIYGESRFPIPRPELQRPGAVPHPVTARRRQLVIERETQSAAIKEYLADQAKMAEMGRAACSGQKVRIWMDWVKAMTSSIEDLRSGVKTTGKGAKWLKMLRDETSLDAEVLAVITCQTVLNLIFLPSFRRKDEQRQSALSAAVAAGARGDAAGVGVPQVSFVSAVVAVGDAVELESTWRQTKSGDGASSYSAKALAAARMLSGSRQRSTVWAAQNRIVPLGSALVDMLLEVATVEVLQSSLHDEELAELGAAPSMGGRSTVSVRAFGHRLQWEGKKTIGYVTLQRHARDQMQLGEGDLVRFIAPKHQPMVMEPMPWKPAGEHPEGAYLMHRAPFIRTSAPNLTCLRAYSPRRVARVMDGLGRTPWRVNRDILQIMEEVRRRDLAIADIPPMRDPKLPSPTAHEGATEQEQRQARLRHLNAVKRARELQSERPTFELKLRVARDFADAPRLYFPHNVDFRGRAYPVPPHLNHISDDACRGLLMFAEAKPLGEEGLFWLKVSLANLLGKNKMPFEERVAYVEERRELILQVAREPLADRSIEFWAHADDGPWQALARCLELAALWASGEPPRGFRSRLPVQLDGSCNGLQHYAALGRDEWGARAVNLTPSERPQDVYSIVLGIVKEKVEAQAATSEPEAGSDDEDEGSRAKSSKTQMAHRLLALGVLQRKVVKQTIMTICYGVTTVGARKQVLGQLEDMVGDKVEPEELKRLAAYLAGLVLKSIDEVFERAMKIKNWFDKVSKVFNQQEVPTSWMSPIGLACVQPYKKVRKVQVATKRQKLTIADEDGPEVHKIRQRMGFPPNFIHSLDASHMMLVAAGCQAAGVAFAGVHDSFWTHACDAPALNRIIREAFIELHQRPTLEELFTDVRLHMGGAEPPPMPKPGTLDISLVRESKYIFN